MAEPRPDPESLSVTDHWLAIIDPVGGVIPLLEGALHFSPSWVVDSSLDGEFLDRRGRQFVAVVYDAAVEAFGAAYDAGGCLRPDEPFQAVAWECHRLLLSCVLLARGLMAEDLPPIVSGHAGLDLVLKNFRKAEKMLQKHEPRREEASHV